VRVALVTKIFPSSIHQWAGHSAYQTIRVLAQRTDLQAFYPYAVYPSALTRFDRVPKPDPTWQPEGVPTTYIPHPGLPGLTRHLNGHLIARKLLPYVRAFRPDIVLSYFIYPYGYAAIRIARALGVPAVLTAIGSDLHSIPDPLTLRLTRSALRDADFVSTTSGDLCTLARTLGADPTRSRPKLNGCDTTVFYPRDKQQSRAALSLDPDKDTVVYVGRLDVRKGLVELIEAAANLGPNRPNLRVYIVGDGPDKPALTAAIVAHNAAPWVTLVPSCPTDQVAIWMAAADLVTLPSYNEGCPNVVIEALAAGRPVVATNVGGIPEIMDDTCGRMVPPRNVPALAQALDEVLTQTWDAKTISAKHGRSWPDVAAELHTVLEEAIAAKRATS
jgi:teichuronic acid biosynthesis glycosyltransferase TuaC